MNETCRWLGKMWASPATLVGLLYVATLKDNLKYIGTFGDANVWVIADKQKFSDKKLLRRLESEPIVIGTVVIMHDHPRKQKYNAVLLKHAQKYVAHWMTFGIFTYPLMVSMKLLLKAMNNVDLLYDNPFEISARRHADQTIDIPGIRKKLTEASKRNKL